jgi:hypothetical protein
MSHFTVLVRIPADQVDGTNIVPALEQMLAPYQENNMGDCPEEYLEFEDIEDEYREKYQTETTERVRMSDGKLLSPYDDQFKRKKDDFINNEYDVPEFLERRKVPFTELYGTFEEFMSDYVGDEHPDPKTGRYGYWRNPNTKWDWWQLGGRWNGRLPVKPGASDVANGSPSSLDDSPKYAKNCVDACRVGELDLDEIAKKTRESAEKWWEKYLLWRSKDYDPNDEKYRWIEYDVRDTCLSLGIISCKDKDELTEEDTDVERWGDRPHCRKEAQDRYDVFKKLTKEEFLAEYLEYFSPITTYAALDKDGWHAPGEMGWFGCSSANPDDKVQFLKEFYRRFIKEANKQDWVAVVDCHI